jgi:NAD(P)-dependent dehydrogenase (short-subunit alcohol dehydrogenase family)
LVDLAEFSSVKAFANRALEELQRLDILLLNAAIATTAFSLTKDGYEEMYVALSTLQQIL